MIARSIGIVTHQIFLEVPCPRLPKPATIVCTLWNTCNPFVDRSSVSNMFPAVYGMGKMTRTCTSFSRAALPSHAVFDAIRQQGRLRSREFYSEKPDVVSTYGRFWRATRATRSKTGGDTGRGRGRSRSSTEQSPWKAHGFFVLGGSSGGRGENGEKRSFKTSFQQVLRTVRKLVHGCL